MVFSSSVHLICSKEWICYWKPICHLSFSQADSAFTHMSHTWRDQCLTWEQRESEQPLPGVVWGHPISRAERKGVWFTSHGQILLFIGASAELVSLDAVTTRMLMTRRGHWLVLIGLLKETKGKHELCFVGIVNNNKIPTEDNWIMCSRRLDVFPE